MEKLGAKESSSYGVMKRPTQTIRCQLQKVNEHSEMKNRLSNRVSELNALHETIFEDQNRLIQENTKLTQELSRLKEENEQAIAVKDKEIEELKKEIAKQSEKLAHDINQLELLVQKSTELENKNKAILEKDIELKKQLYELQERLVTKDKIIRMKTQVVHDKQKDLIILKEHIEQLLYIYEKSLKDKLKNISDMCVNICSESSSTIEDNEEEAETSV